jgi:hypothetical protein
MRKPSILRASILILPILVVSAGSGRAETAAAPSPAAKTPAIDPQAKEALTRMGDFFKSLPAFAVHEDITREQVIDSDLKVQKSSSAEVVVRRPNGLKAEVLADDAKAHAMYFDGKKLSVFLPVHNYYAQADAPGTLGPAMDMAESRYGIEFPTSDLLRMASGEDFTRDLTAAGLVGTSRVGDTECDHYAYRNADVDYQLWIQAGDKPLPRKLVITSKKQPAQPEFTAVLTWDLSPKIDDSTFAFNAPQGATRIVFGTAPAQPQKGVTQPQKAPQPKQGQ